jgi:hypothetical protein
MKAREGMEHNSIYSRPQWRMEASRQLHKHRFNPGADPGAGLETMNRETSASAGNRITIFQFLA